MRRAAPFLAAMLALLGLLARAGGATPALSPTPETTPEYDSPGLAPPTMGGRDVRGDDLMKLQDWGRSALKQRFGLDVERYSSVNVLSINRPGTGGRDPVVGLAPSLMPPEARKMNFAVTIQALDQSVRFDNLAGSLPLSVHMLSEVELLPSKLNFRTEANVPLHQGGTLTVDSSLHLPDLNLPVVSRLLREGGLTSPWMMLGTYQSGPDMSVVGTGLSTKVLGDWNFRYMFEARLGSPTETHRLGLGRDF